MMFMEALVAAAIQVAPVGPAVTATVDPPADAAHPAATKALVLDSGGSTLNAAMYVASGPGRHPTLLLLHGLPGTEPNLDLAQAARRAGWNVLFFHYRGSWGSGGSFSFAHCLEDAANAVAFLRRPEVAAEYGIDPARIAVAGHSMGGMIAARTVADDKALLGAFLIDPADVAAVGRAIADPARRAAFRANTVHEAMPPLSGTSEDQVVDDFAHAGTRLDLVETMPALASRPLALVSASRGRADMASLAEKKARSVQARDLTVVTMQTDHSFSDKRIALETELVRWLARFGPTPSTKAR